MICPVCTIAIGTGVGLFRWLGIGDSVTGLWVGGFLVSLVAVTISWFDKKRIVFIGRKIIVTAGYYLLTIIPLYWAGIMGNPLNKIWGVDKLLFGIISGSVGLLAGVLLHSWLRNKNNGKSFFPFQKVIIPILPLAILSAIFYYLIN